MKKLVLTLIIILYPFLSWSENIYLCKQKLISRIDFDLERQEWFDVMTEKSRNLMKGGSWVKGFRISFTDDFKTLTSNFSELNSGCNWTNYLKKVVTCVTDKNRTRNNYQFPSLFMFNIKTERFQISEMSEFSYIAGNPEKNETFFDISIIAGDCHKF